MSAREEREIIEKPEAEEEEVAVVFRARAALSVSVVVTLAALLAFGYVKGRFTGAPPVRSAIQTGLMGGLAAAAAFGIARAIS